MNCPYLPTTPNIETTSFLKFCASHCPSIFLVITIHQGNFFCPSPGTLGKTNCEIFNADGTLSRSWLAHDEAPGPYITIPQYRWGWVLLERTWILSGIQFTTHFIESFVVETKRFVGSFVNLIFTRQTCGQRSSIGNYFSERICYMFLISKCRGDRHLGLCTTSGLAFGEPQRNDKFRFFLHRNTFFSGSRHCVAVLQTQVP